MSVICGKKFLKVLFFPVELNIATVITSSEENRIVREKLRKAVLLNLGHALASPRVLSKRLITQVILKPLVHGPHFEKQRSKQ